MTQTTNILNSLKWRCIGPPRGGRVVTVAGHPTEWGTFYFGACAGGVWKTTDGGTFWENISDGFFNTAAIGAIAVANSDPNVVYAGTGEHTIRIDVSHGDGVYKSTDGGASWRNIGLKDSRHIAKIRVHPQNPDIVYVAALGNPYGHSEERGVFRSQDGGDTWEQVLYKSDKAGAVDLVMDVTNPRVLYAALYEMTRNFYSMSSGGEDSGLYKSVDGGDTWVEISNNEGLPTGIKGKIGIAIAPTKPNRVWAIVEAKDTGLYRSDDSGATWRKLKARPEIHSRPWYFHHIFAHPTNADTVYALSVDAYKSIDGGETFHEFTTPHGDNHDLWIDPNFPQRMIIGDDGGAAVSYNDMGSWSTIYNQMTAQIYRLTTDNQYPYRVYGTQQDNSSVSVPSRTGTGAITWADCTLPGTGESGHIAVKADDPNIVIVGAIGSSVGGGGALQKYDHRTKQLQLITVWPQNTQGRGAEAWKYRFQWTFPIRFSPHDVNILYTTANVVFRSSDMGQSWEAISPDLTRHDPDTLKPSGGPITLDTTGAENYATIYAFEESPHERGVFWAGSDDGLIHLSRDGGASWTNVTPSDLPEWTMIHSLEVSPHEAGTMYFAGIRYKNDDFQPYLYKTNDYGDTWQKIVNGIPDTDFARVIREDKSRRGLLYAGTETGIYVSFDDGENWQRAGGNFPVVPVYDLALKEDDLVVATHGRSFWILDDVTLLQNANNAVSDTLFPPRKAIRQTRNWSGDWFVSEAGKVYHASIGSPATFTMTRDKTGAMHRHMIDAGEDAPAGAMIHYYLTDVPETPLSLQILDAEGQVLREFSSARQEGEGEKVLIMPVSSGLNRFLWDLRIAPATKMDNHQEVEVSSPLVTPGLYTVVLQIGDQRHEAQFEVAIDPRVEITPAELQAQYDLLVAIRDQQSALHEGVNRLQKVKAQVEMWAKRAEPDTAMAEAFAKINERIEAVEGVLVQTKGITARDMNVTSRLVEELAGLPIVIESADNAPTRQSQEAFAELSARADVALTDLDDLLVEGIGMLNGLLGGGKMPAIEL